MNCFEVVEKAKSQGWKIGFYGLGRVYEKAACDLIRLLAIEPDFYSDRNEKRLRTFDAITGKKIPYDNLVRLKDELLVIATVGREIDKEIKEMFYPYPNIHIVSFYDICNNDEFIMGYFRLDESFRHYEKNEKIKCRLIKPDKTKKVAVYTCITGDYDSVNEPLYIDENCDYFLITDNMEQKISGYKKVCIDEIISDRNLSNKGKNRYCKMHGYEIFNEYKYCVYLDGNLQLVGSINRLLDGIGEYGLGFHSHPIAVDPYMDAMSLSLRNRVRKEEAESVVKKFFKSGLPRDYGSVEGGLIVCENDNEMASAILSKWYENYIEGEAKRDQLYLPYTLFQLGVDVDDVNTFKCNLRMNGITKLIQGHSGYQV